MTSATSIAILDVAYAADAAGLACVLADSWTAPTAATEISQSLACMPAEYVPGEFYRRELPLLRALIDDLVPRPSTLVIDGYVWLGGVDAPGLGARLFEALHSATPVVGVAKTRYRGDTWSEQVYRGDSRPAALRDGCGCRTCKGGSARLQHAWKPPHPDLAAGGRPARTRGRGEGRRVMRVGRSPSPPVLVWRSDPRALLSGHRQRADGALDPMLDPLQECRQSAGT